MENLKSTDLGSLISWRSVAAGLIVSVLSYMILCALGAGVFGLSAAHLIEKGQDAPAFATGAGLWLGASAVISLFLGGYFATRFSEVTHKQVGACQAIVISGLFFYLLISGTGSILGSLSGIAFQISNASGVSDAELAARAVGDAGWLLFVTFSLGVIAAIIGGIEGALGNRRRPFSRLHAKAS